MNQRAWIVIVSIALACASTSVVPDPAPVPEPELAPAPAPEFAPELAPEVAVAIPTPLVELDADAIAALPEPTPVADPPPFDDAMLERILAVQDIVNAAAAKQGVDPALINGLIWVESKFDPKARGPAGAQGIMQIMPKTAAALAKQLGRKRNSFDPDFSIHAGTLMLAQLLRRFDGDVRLALAGYNRGGGTVAKWVAAGEPLPEGAEKFVQRVLRAKRWFEQPLGMRSSWSGGSAATVAGGASSAALRSTVSTVSRRYLDGISDGQP